MSKTKHTPGPWFVKKSFKGDVHDFYIEIKKGIIAATYPTIWPSNNKANAHLLAAAPDLLEVLKSIENDDGRIPETIWKMRNDAIAKAEGKV